jgi:uncharacterized membrane protein YdbT with pleckstrin-like domain
VNASRSRPNHATMLIICGALCMGPIFFAVITLFIALQRGLLFTVKELTVIAIIIAPIMSRSGISQIKKKLTDAEKKDGDLLQLHAGNIFQSSTIIRFALIEGAVFMLLLVSFIESNFLPWIIGVLLVALMVTQIPFRVRYDEAIDSISRKLRG